MNGREVIYSTPESYYIKDSQFVRTHYQTPAVALIIPGLQAFLTGVFLGVVAGVLSVSLEWGHPWRAGFLIWAGVQAVTWLCLLVRWANIVVMLETVLNVDLNQDGLIGEDIIEAEEVQPVRIEVIQDEGRHVQFANLPIPEKKLTALAVGLSQGAGLSEGQWTGKGAVFSRSEFRTLRDLFVTRGWLQWVNTEAHSQGLQLTHPGKAVMRYYCSRSGSPPTLLASGNGTNGTHQA